MSYWFQMNTADSIYLVFAAPKKGMKSNGMRSEMDV